MSLRKKKPVYNILFLFSNTVKGSFDRTRFWKSISIGRRDKSLTI